MTSQQNGYDCGLYVCAVAEALCSITAQQQEQHQQQEAQGNQQQQQPSEQAEGCDCSDKDAQLADLEREALQKISSGYITELRQKMLRVIEDLAEQRQ
jgi:hypothetical protein